MLTKSHLGVYAIIEKDDRLLLVKKTRGPYTGMWDLPGGSPAHGETLFQTLQREVVEETGIEIAEVTSHSNHAFLLEYIDGVNLISFHHTCLIYKVTVFDLSNYTDLVNEEDVSGCAWIERSKLNLLGLSRVVRCVFP